MDKRIIVCRDCSGSIGEMKREMFKTHLTKFSEELRKTMKNDEKLFFDAVGFTTIDLFKISGSLHSILSTFNVAENGGTYMSTGLKSVDNTIENTGTNEEIHVLFYTDGDNWGEDNDDTINCIKEIAEYDDTYFYFTECKTSTYKSTIGNRVIKEIDNKNVFVSFIHNLTQVEENIKSLFVKPKEYMTLEEATNTGKKVKHKDGLIWYGVPQNALTDAIGKTRKNMFELLKVKEFEVLDEE